MKTESDFPRKLVEHPDMAIVMPDGCRLSARVWMPEDAVENPVPAILEHLPYRKRDGTIARDERTHPWLAGHGYAAIRVDMRGNGDSAGLMADEYTEQELQDACDVIEWAAAQDWCNGKVGMMGISWGGFNALQVAVMRPPALKAIITICSTTDRFADDIHYKGGALLGENFGWASTMLAYSSRPPDPEIAGEAWRDMWRHRLENQPFHAREWLARQWRDAYWKHGSVCEAYGAIEAAVLAIGGWHDGYRNTMAHLAENLPTFDNPNVKAIAGPWIHKYPHLARPGPAIDFLGEAKQWWDRWLKGVGNGADDLPAFRLWLMDSIAPARWVAERPGRWIASAAWPDAAVSQRRLHLCDSGLGDAPGPFTHTICSPQDCGLEAGEYFPFFFADELPGNQTPDDEKSLCFDGEPLAGAADIVGAPRVHLTLSSDRPCAQIAVRLCDLRPDGTSALIMLGILNLSHRHSHEKPEALTPGEPVDIALDLDQIAYRVPAGHRLRLAISTAYWPFIWPSPEAAVLTVTAGTLDLPVRKTAAGDECTFGEPRGAPAWQADELRSPRYARQVERDSETGIVTLSIEADSGLYCDRDHGLLSGSKTVERWSIHPDDPASARVEIVTDSEGGREGARWETRAASQMTCDTQAFHVSARLTCRLNGEAFFENDFSDRIARRLV